MDGHTKDDGVQFLELSKGIVEGQDFADENASIAGSWQRKVTAHVGQTKVKSLEKNCVES